MSSLVYPEATLCGAGAEGKTGDELFDHYREFVGKVWESESPPGVTLLLRPKTFPKSEGKVVSFLTVEQLRVVQPRTAHEFEHQFDSSSAVLMGSFDNIHKFLLLNRELTKARLIKCLGLMTQRNEECVVCYEQTGPGERVSITCEICAANVCMQCSIDIALDAKLVGFERKTHCALCTAPLTMTFPTLISINAMVEWTPSEDSESEAHKEFANFWNDFGFGDKFRALRCDFSKMSAKMRDAIELEFEAHLREDLHRSQRQLRDSPTEKKRSFNRRVVDGVKIVQKILPPLLRRALRECDKVKTEVKSASDDSLANAAASGSVVPNRVRSDRCARCEKVFWDKKEKKRAPKCPKCKRVAYCSGVCRKKHRAAHKLQCEAGDKAKKKKKAAVKADKLHGR